MALEEKDYYAALGIEPPSQQPEAADPAAGANEPGVAARDGAEQADNRHQGTGDAGTRIATAPAEPRNDNDETPAEDAGDGEAGGGETDSSPAAQNDRDGKGAMSRAERAEQARLRREREQKAAVDAAVQAALQAEREKNKANMKAMFESAGMVDRYHDNKPITSLEEFNAFQAARQADKLNRELQSGKLTPESFQAAVDNSPAVREARETVERLKAREKAETEAARKAEFDARVKDELAEIHRLNPAVNSLDDILAMQTAGEFTRLVRDKGMSFLEAFKLANLDDIIEGQAAAAAEGAARQRHGKDHLRSINAGGQVPVDVPPDVIANYRMFQPDMSLEEIQRDYAKRYGK